MEEPLRRPYVIDIELDENKDQPVKLSVAKNEQKKKRRSVTGHLQQCFHKFDFKKDRERMRTPIESIIWLLISALCIVYCGILILNYYDKWVNSPNVVKFDEKKAPIWKIPFPAVTVCPKKKILSKVFTFKNYYSSHGNISKTEQDMYEDLSLICDDIELEKGREYVDGNETVANIRKASPGLNRVMDFCMWNNKHTNCSENFTSILTEEGICYTFNTIGPDDLFHMHNLNKDYEYMDYLNRTKIRGWTLNNGYINVDPKINTYPYMTKKSGLGSGWEFGLQHMSEADYDPDCMGNLTGFKIILHSPFEFPQSAHEVIQASVEEIVNILVEPSMTVTSGVLRAVSPESRDCYYENERKLKYFKFYTQNNCALECLSNFTYEACGCVSFGTPHAPDMKICSKDIRDDYCIGEAERDLNMISVLKPPGFEDCNCLPACTSIKYNTQVYREPMPLLARYVFDFKGTKINIFFKSNQFEVMKRTQLYNISDFLANCGGILGLFLGFSVINILETMYFCMLRICCRRASSNKNV